MFTDGTQRKLPDGNFEDWCGDDPGQVIEEVPRDEAERLVMQSRV